MLQFSIVNAASNGAESVLGPAVAKEHLGGAAALGIVQRYHGLYLPLAELRVACGVSRDGSKASNILRAARKYGMVSHGMRLQPFQLEKQKLPAIVFWQFNHFVVVEGFDRSRVYLNDPAFGPRYVSRQEFDEGFTGVALLIEPGPDFEPVGTPTSIVACAGSSNMVRRTWPARHSETRLASRRDDKRSLRVFLCIGGWLDVARDARGVQKLSRVY